ncbi:MAG: hypothetical protein VZR53_08880 [Prevotella sp.]|nr:hypothetical protein [Prevotella sp.]
MATTKAAKSITINSTKYELANTLDYQNGKVQLKAKDVVLDETEVGGSEAIFIYNHYDSGEGYYVTDAIKDIAGNTLTNAEACNKVKAGAQIYVQVVAASGSSFGQFQLLDKYEHEEYGGGSVVQEHFWSEGNAFNKYISMTFRLANNFVSAPNIEDKDADFVITLDDNQYLSTTGYKTCTSFNGVDLANAVKAGKTIKIVGTNIYNEDDNARDSVCLVCDATDADQGAQVFLTAVYKKEVLTFLAADYTTVSSINLISIFPLTQP